MVVVGGGICRSASCQKIQVRHRLRWVKERPVSFTACFSDSFVRVVMTNKTSVKTPAAARTSDARGKTAVAEQGIPNHVYDVS